MRQLVEVLTAARGAKSRDTCFDKQVVEVLTAALGTWLGPNQNNAIQTIQYTKIRGYCGVLGYKAVITHKHLVTSNTLHLFK